MGSSALANDLSHLRGLTGQAAIQAFRNANPKLAKDHKTFCGTQDDAMTRAEKLLQEATRRALADGDDPNGGVRTDENADGVALFPNSAFVRRTRTETPVIFLDFEPDEGQLPTFEVDLVDAATNEVLNTFVLPDFVFQPADRAFIRDRIAADLEPYGFRVVTERPAEGLFTEIEFANNDRTPGGRTNVTLFNNPDGSTSFSILFGRANEIDFADDNLDSGAFTDTSFWVVLQALFPAETFQNFTGIVADTNGDDIVDDDALRQAVLNQGANTGIHEVGHTLGLRHHDSIGPFGFGLPTTGRPAPDAFVPEYTGSTDAFDTTRHIMASGASVGLSLAGATTVDRVFSQRSNLKLQLATRQSLFTTEEQLERFNRFRTDFGDNRVINYLPAIPNYLTRRPGEADRPFTNHWFQGAIEGPDGADTYSFWARRGD
ncbi:MAG: hypothetical protein AAFV29_02995, partial [Myxococcota bacterium]